MSNILNGINNANKRQTSLTENEELKGDPAYLANLESAYNQIKQISKSFKHLDPGGTVASQIGLVAAKHKINYTPEYMYAMDELNEASDALVSAVFNVEQVLEDLIDIEHNRISDEEEGLTEAGRSIIKSLDGIEKAFTNPHSPEAKNWARKYARAKNDPHSSYNWKKNQKQKEKQAGTQHKQTLKDIAKRAASQIQTVISDVFPDGDPSDYVLRWIRKELSKAGISNANLEMDVDTVWELAQRIFNKEQDMNMEQYMASMWDQLQADNPDNDMWKGNNPFNVNEDEKPHNNSYPVTYSKIHKNKQDPTKVDYVELYHANINLGNNQPSTPERVKHLVDMSEKHKSLSSTGYSLVEYGKHLNPNKFYGYPTKIVNDVELNEVKRNPFKPVDTIVLTDEEYKKLRQAKMHGKFNFVFYQNPKTKEVTFKIPKGKEKEFLRSIGRLIDFGATTAEDVFNLNHLGLFLEQDETKTTNNQVNALRAFLSVSPYKQNQILSVKPDSRNEGTWLVDTKDGKSHVLLLGGYGSNKSTTFTTMLAPIKQESSIMKGLQY